VAVRADQGKIFKVAFAKTGFVQWQHMVAFDVAVAALAVTGFEVE
jgi:hypothetical protein